MINRIEELKSFGIQPYAEESNRNTLISDAKKHALKNDPCLNVCITGRIKAVRKQGKITFYDIEDQSDKIQIICRSNHLGEDNYKKITHLMCDGDIVEIHGYTMLSETNTPSIMLNEFRMIAPCIEVMQKNIKNVQLRFSNRTIDIINNEKAKKILTTRSKVLFSLRQSLEYSEFLEMTTPVLMGKYGGGKSKPFTTQYNALDREMFLRPTMDLYLKRILAGGFERVYEIGKCFRNEGICPYYSSEFTALEAYAAYINSIELENIIKTIIDKGIQIVNENFELLWDKYEWNNLNYTKACKDILNLDVSDFSDYKGIKKQCIEKKYNVEQSMNIGDLHSKIAEFILGSKLINPTLLRGLPVSTSPLMKTDKNNRAELDRAWFFINGIMFCDLAGEISDPTEQLERLEEQKGLLTMHNYDNVDLRHINALKTGVPCMSGIGMGIDRFLLGATKLDHIREVIPFPLQYENIKTR